MIELKVEVRTVVPGVWKGRGDSHPSKLESSQHWHENLIISLLFQQKEVC